MKFYRGDKKLSPGEYAKLALEALKVAVKKVKEENMLRGIPLSIWKDGKVQFIQPKDL